MENREIKLIKKITVIFKTERKIAVQINSISQILT